MIPLKLRLKNFMCYREPEPLDLHGIHLACLAGDNGHGKSALLDAITWALWGKARARQEDELVSIGQQAMEVELEFRLGDNCYRVIRKRELSPKSRSALDLQIRENDRFRSFTGNTQRETQARIDGLLRLDYDTFINSALILQGRADEFTVKAPADRKRILGDILGLSIYDEYEERTKVLVRERQEAEREVQARIQEIERELEHRTEYERELAAADADLVQAGNRARAAELELQQLRDRVGTLEAQKAQLSDVDRRMQSAESKIRDLDQQITAQNTRLRDYESIVQRRPEIEAGHGQLLKTRSMDAEFSTTLSRLVSLNDERRQLDATVTESRRGLEVQERVLAGKIEELTSRAALASSLRADCAKVSEELGQLKTLQDKAETTRQSIRKTSDQASVLKAENDQLKVQMASLKGKVTLLREQTATCPLCGQGLGEDDRLRLLAQLEEEGQQDGDRYRHDANKLKEIDSEIKVADAALKTLERELRRLPALQGRESTLQASIQEAEEAAARREEQHRSWMSVQQQLQQGAFALEEQQKLAELTAHISALGYDPSRHQQVREDLKALVRFESEKAELDRAEEALAGLRENQQQLTTARQSWVASLESDRQRCDELSTAVADLGALQRRVMELQPQVDELRSTEGHSRQRVGAAQQKLDHCNYLAGERKERAKHLRDLAEERSLYDELRVAFGKKGIQALIIENVLPELEGEANTLLSRMTDGRMSLHFETQHDTKSGTTVETLDIKISDENGPRSYELYSGGEAFRINFAIRIALSKLLARRAGAQLQTLIIDEGFGTQDVQGRQRLVEAINSIQNDFALILVITHIEELKDAFPVRIDVYKTPEGSQISIS